MTETKKRFIIEDYGIYDTLRDDKQLTWRELCDTLNELYLNADIDIQLKEAELRKKEEENKKLKYKLEEISRILCRN